MEQKGFSHEMNEGEFNEIVVGTTARITGRTSV
jgi:hypothetical protein